MKFLLFLPPNKPVNSGLDFGAAERFPPKNLGFSSLLNNPFLGNSVLLRPFGLLKLFLISVLLKAELLFLNPLFLKPLFLNPLFVAALFVAALFAATLFVAALFVAALFAATLFAATLKLFTNSSFFTTTPLFRPNLTGSRIFMYLRRRPIASII